MDDRWTGEQVFEDNDVQNKVFGVGYKFKKSKVRIKNHSSLKFFSLLIVMILGVLFLSINFANNVISVSSGAGLDLSLESKNYYAISLSNFSSKEIASTVSEEVKNLGGAGYIYSNGEFFYILTSVYLEQNSANSVLQKLSNMNYNPSIIQMSANAVDFKADVQNLTHEQKENISNLLCVYDEVINLFNDLSISFDKGVIKFTEVKQEILLAYENYLPKHKQFLTDVEDLNSEKFSNLTKSLHFVFEELEKMSNVNVEYNNFSSTLKSSLIAITVARCNL